MGDSASGQGGGARSRRGTPKSSGSVVLTPPTGIPTQPDLETLVPGQRTPDDTRPTAPPRTVVEPCTCGHARAAHDHYRPGTDCGACGAEGCDAFRPEGGSVRKALRRMRLTD